MDGTESEHGPGTAHQAFLTMEELGDKLKLLRYEETFLKQHNMKPFSRHYFALATNPGEQFHAFASLASWLINQAGRPFEAPHEHDDPNATLARILTELRNTGAAVDFPPSRLKTGCGELVCYTLDRLAEAALTHSNFAWQMPLYPEEVQEDEAIVIDDSELTLDKVEESAGGNVDDYEDEEEDESLLDLDKIRSKKQETPGADVLESQTDAAAWSLELERILPQLRVTVRSDHKDWRSHIEQMHQHREGIDSALLDSKGQLERLQEEMSRTLEKISSREKYMNTQLEGLIQQYRTVQQQLAQVKDQYRQGSGGVTERAQTLAEITEELEKVKQDMEERGSSMTDGGPLVRIKQALTRLKQEMEHMDVRVGVVEHMLLQARVSDKHDMTRDMHANGTY
ncbi:intraflagellar transport protein 57 homolog [Petromyzon marinus]|uniref:intraflagellar transport protein 57 homolog n=1 Tax=Petromyzon marinus TaxID=7757 RepID=UPI003F7269C0